MATLSKSTILSCIEKGELILKQSFAFNTKADPSLFANQFQLMRRIVEADFDVYGYVTLTSPTQSCVRQKISDFVDRLQEVHPFFPLRTIPLRVGTYTPTRGRLDDEKRRALEIQEEAVVAWKEELELRYSPEILRRGITEHRINQH